MPEPGGNVSAARAYKGSSLAVLVPAGPSLRQVVGGGRLGSSLSVGPLAGSCSLTWARLLKVDLFMLIIAALHCLEALAEEVGVTAQVPVAVIGATHQGALRVRRTLVIGIGGPDGQVRLGAEMPLRLDAFARL